MFPYFQSSCLLMFKRITVNITSHPCHVHTVTSVLPWLDLCKANKDTCIPPGVGSRIVVLTTALEQSVIKRFCSALHNPCSCAMCLPLSSHEVISHLCSLRGRVYRAVKKINFVLDFFLFFTQKCIRSSILVLDKDNPHKHRMLFLI